jgi:hypothetical protein
LSGISIGKNWDFLGDTDECALVGCGRSEGSKSGEKDTSHLDFFNINYNFILNQSKDTAT